MPKKNIKTEEQTWRCDREA